MEIIINDDNLEINEVDELSTKVRAILIDENNQILIANYGSVILLPGGKLNKGETLFEAVKRELNEELGRYYSSEQLEFFTTINYYQKNYPKRDGTFQNRLVQTHYFIGQYKGVRNDLQSLSEKEQKGNFRLELVPLESLENIILKNQNNNPRNIYFQRELLTVLDRYKKLKQGVGLKKTKKLELKF